MRSLTATFVPNAEGRVMLDVDVICSDRISYETIVFNTVHFLERQTEVLRGKGEKPLQLFELE